MIEVKISVEREILSARDRNQEQAFLNWAIPALEKNLAILALDELTEMWDEWIETEREAARDARDNYRYERAVGK